MVAKKIFPTKELQLIATGDPGPYLAEFMLHYAKISMSGEELHMYRFGKDADDAVFAGITRNLQKTNLIEQITFIDVSKTAITHKGLKKALPKYVNLEGLEVDCGQRLDLLLPLLRAHSKIETVTIDNTVVGIDTRGNLSLCRKQFRRRQPSDDVLREIRDDLQSCGLARHIVEIELIDFKRNRASLDISARTFCSLLRKCTGLRVLKLADREEFRDMLPAVNPTLAQLPRFEKLFLCSDDDAPQLIQF